MFIQLFKVKKLLTAIRVDKSGFFIENNKDPYTLIPATGAY